VFLCVLATNNYTQWLKIRTISSDKSRHNPLQGNQLQRENQL